MALLQVSSFSKTLGMQIPMQVILPDLNVGAVESIVAGSEYYPVLYLLHGMSSDHMSWCSRSSIERYAMDKGIAVIMPTTHLAWYTDQVHGLPYWTYISQELPQICRYFFSRLSPYREDTYVAGLSMGGYGALKCGLLMAQSFSHVATLSGGLDVVRICEETATEEKPDPIWANTFGSAQEAKGSENDLFAAAERLAASGKPMPRIYQYCGTDDFLYQDNLRMRDHLKALGFDLEYFEEPGDHSWKYWDEQIKKVLDWLPLKPFTRLDE